MKVVSKDLGPLNKHLTVTLTQEDYQPKYTSELSRYQKTGQFRGFRKGKAPLSLVKKMYGQGLLTDILFRKVQDDLAAYLKESGWELLGQAIPSDTQEELVVDINADKAYDFEFEVGLAPELNLQHAGEEAVYTYMDVTVTPERIDEEMEKIRKSAGKRVETTAPAEGNDMLSILGKELDEKGELKKKGHEITLSLLVDAIRDEEVKNKVTGQTKGFEFEFDVTTIEGEKDRTYINKYLLQLDEGDEREVGNKFKGEILSVNRLEPAEMNEAFFEQVFGKDRVKNEAEARTEIEKSLQNHFDNQADAVLFRNIQDRLFEDNKVEYPDDFMKKWLRYNNPELDEKALEEGYDSFKEDLTWTLVRNRILKNNGITITKEDIVRGFYADVISYFGGQQMPQEFMESAVKRMMENEEQVQKMEARVAVDKMFEKLKEVVKLEKKEISIEELEKVLEGLRTERSGK